jgi:hypothetical protein
MTGGVMTLETGTESATTGSGAGIRLVEQAAIIRRRIRMFALV